MSVQVWRLQLIVAARIALCSGLDRDWDVLVDARRFLAAKKAYQEDIPHTWCATKMMVQFYSRYPHLEYTDRWDLAMPMQVGLEEAAEAIQQETFRGGSIPFPPNDRVRMRAARQRLRVEGIHAGMQALQRFLTRDLRPVFPSDPRDPDYRLVETIAVGESFEGLTESITAALPAKSKGEKPLEFDANLFRDLSQAALSMFWKNAGRSSAVLEAHVIRIVENGYRNAIDRVNGGVDVEDASTLAQRLIRHKVFTLMQNAAIRDMGLLS